MRCHSTRNPAREVGLSQALKDGLAADGGLYVPEQLAPVSVDRLAASPGLAALASELLAPYFASDALASELAAIAREAFSFAAPLVALPGAEDLAVLELFHGPTAAFKDFGARFLAASLARVPKGGRALTILVATSGDTGGAVASAFHRRSGIRVVVLYPRGLVSPRQEQQLTCWGENVASYAVRGTFDDCQALVKSAFADPQLTARLELSSANSINIGRLLPQVVYHAHASLTTWRRTGTKANVVVPSGNLGNVLACVWARQMGLPIGAIVLAHNANRTVPDYFATGVWEPRPSIPTIASAMDVGNPSNMERLRDLYPAWESVKGALRADTVSDAAIRERIRVDYARYRRAWCPHTAVAAECYARLPRGERAAGPWILVATAHPAKFPEIVEPLIGGEIPVPEPLARLLDLPRQVSELEPSLAALRDALA
jgi:threonine synthase